MPLIGIFLFFCGVVFLVVRETSSSPAKKLKFLKRNKSKDIKTN